MVERFLQSLYLQTNATAKQIQPSNRTHKTASSFSQAFLRIVHPSFSSKSYVLVEVETEDLLIS